MKRRVLILCTGNSARSQLAEALVNARMSDEWEAFSAGTQPAAQVNPNALTVLAEIGVQTAGSHPKPISTFLGQPFDAVITVCDDAAENCPVWLGQGKRLHIGFPDPAQVVCDSEIVIAAFRETRNAIVERLLPVLKVLPSQKLNEEKTMDKPIACDLNAIPDDQRQGHIALTESLFAQVEERQALSDGYAFRFPASLLQTAAQFVSLERLCCPFFDFNLDVEDERLWLRLTGPEGAKELLEVEFGITPEA